MLRADPDTQTGMKLNKLQIAACTALVSLGCGGAEDSGTQCGPGTVNDNGVCVPSGADGGEQNSTDAGGTVPPDALRVFVTSTDYERDIGGVTGAASLCNASAAAAGLSGTYVPWLSNSQGDAIDGIFGEGPWYSTGDELTFLNRANLSTSPRTAINRDELGGLIPFESTSRVWTGTAAGGDRDNICAGDWFGTGTNGFATVGSLRSAASEWTDSENIDCIAGGTSAHIYCFERPSF